MEELRDILKEAITKIDSISPSTSTSQDSTNSGDSAASTVARANSTYQGPSNSAASVSSTITRAQSNFRAAFPHLYQGSRHPGPLSNPRPRKKARTVPFQTYHIKDTWTHDFLLLSSPSMEKTPSLSEMSALSLAGLGRRRIVFSNKRGDFNLLKATLEKEFPKLQSQKGAFELLRADRGGATRPLVIIPLPAAGYSIPYLKDVVTSSAVIYVRPIQSELSMQEVETQNSNLQVLTQCVNCHTSIPLKDIRVHMDVCGGGSSSASTSDEITCIDITGNEDASSKMGWMYQLQELFPNNPNNPEVESVVRDASTLEEAAERLCEKPEEKHSASVPQNIVQDTGYHANASSLVKSLASKLQGNDHVLTVERDEIWKGALAFYKKGLVYQEKLWANLIINFKGEEGLDGGAMKAEFFDLLLQQIQRRLFEGDEYSMIPVKDRSKGMLLKLAGVVIAHSIIQWGPCFSVPSPAVYFQLAGADPDKVLSNLRKTDLPLNAGTAILHELMEKLEKGGEVQQVLEDDPSSAVYWATINAAHWPLAKHITNKDVPLLLQLLLENEVILSRKFEIDQLAEGLSVLGLLKEIRNNKEAAYTLLCYDVNSHLTAEQLSSHISCHDEPTDFAQKQSYDWFRNYIKDADEGKLRTLLQFITGYRSVPPRGLPHKICLKYLPDDDENAMLTSSACLAILHLPTIHSSEAKFIFNFDNALRFESQGFGSA